MADKVPDRFPAGLRVLVVDDDITCLTILEQMLRRCLYCVTSCSRASAALNMLRERKGCFDVVLSDVHMPDMDGFRLLELVGLEMDLPVIMMSVDTSTSAVMRGVRHGACDYLIKPIREEALKNIWQHVVRKKRIESKEPEHSGSLEENDQHKRGNDDGEYASSVNEGTDVLLKAQKKRRDITEDDDGELLNDDHGTSKKPRVVWSVELHQQFVCAVNQLGIDKAVPKRILELMNVPGLTRENVASHLQKFRLYLKRLSGVAQQQGGIHNSFCSPIESNLKIGSTLGRFDIQALEASGQFPPQTLAALHTELYGRREGTLVLPAAGQPALLQASLQGSLQGPRCIPAETEVPFGQPLLKCQSNMSKSFSPEDVSSGLGAWPSNSLCNVGSSANLRGLNTQNGNTVVDILQQQEQHHHMSMQPGPNPSINVQPSCLVVPSRSSVSYPAGSSPASVNQNPNFNRSSSYDYSLLSPQSNNSHVGFGHGLDRNLKTTGVLSGYSAPASISPSMSVNSVRADNGTVGKVQHSAAIFSATKQLQGVEPNIGGNQCHSNKSGEVLDQGPLRNLGFVGKGNYIPSRFAVDELESPTSNMTHREKMYGEGDGSRVKQEPNPDFVENDGLAMSASQNFSNDLMGIFTK